MTLRAALERAVEVWWDRWHQLAEPDDQAPEWVDTICEFLGAEFNLGTGRWKRRR